MERPLTPQILKVCQNTIQPDSLATSPHLPVDQRFLRVPPRLPPNHNSKHGLLGAHVADPLRTTVPPLLRVRPTYWSPIRLDTRFTQRMSHGLFRSKRNILLHHRIIRLP